MADYYNIEFMKKYIAAPDKIDKDYIFTLPEPDRTVAFYAYFGANDRGTAWQKAIINDYWFLSHVPSSKRKGDICNSNGAYIEIKVSYSDKGNNYSFWQCRPWEQTTGYLFKSIDRNDGWRHLNYFLTKNEFLYELSIYGNLDLTHGSKKDLPGELTINSAVEWKKELTVRLKSGGNKCKVTKRTKRWNKLYLVDDIGSVLGGITPYDSTQ